jgi:NAD(P)-dependent dehydrogenase (short-subunit alcohol dehydrogenase family)
MSPSPSIALILGAGSNIGHHVGRAFSAKGYKVVSVARGLKEASSTSDQIHIQGDLSNPASIADLFAMVKTQVGYPSVVVYNGMKNTKIPLSPAQDFSLIFLKLLREPQTTPRTLLASLLVTSSATWLSIPVASLRLLSKPF